jgi:uncharacterized protein (TIGR03437 family)
MLDSFRVGALVVWVLLPLPVSAALMLSSDGLTVYDNVNNISWLANANLAATNRFGLAVCKGAGSQPCVYPSGVMQYQGATAWVAAMNAANYLGHSNWQLPTTPITDSGCGKVGPQNNSFAFGCTLNALGSLYYNGLALKAPNTAVPIPANTAGPFSNFQPYLYWSQTIGGNPNDACYANMGCGNATLSFNTGFQGANTVDNFLYVLPMIAGKIAGTPAATGTGLEVNPGGQTVYDPVTNVTWLANANLAASNAFGLPSCTSPTTPAVCVNRDGAMTLGAAAQFIANMNAAAYLGQTNWELPPTGQSCTGYNCSAADDPMTELFYSQLGFSEGTPVVATPDITVGPFNNIQPYLYWSCEAPTIQDPCQSTGPATGFEWTFSFGNGFLGTDIVGNEFYVTAYYVGVPTSIPGPAITNVQNAATFQTTLAPSTYAVIFGENLSTTNSGRAWTAADFTSNSNGILNMPTALDGTSVTIGGVPAYISYIRPGQINIITPANIAPGGNIPVVVSVSGQVSAAFKVTLQSLAPSFFAWQPGPPNNGVYLIAQHADGSDVGKAGFSRARQRSRRRLNPGKRLFSTGQGLDRRVPRSRMGSRPTRCIRSARRLRSRSATRRRSQSPSEAWFRRFRRSTSST